MTNKLFYFFMVSFILTFGSCTNDDNSDTNLILPKAMVHKDKNNNAYQTTTFTYDANKIVSVSNENRLIRFTYDGDEIVKEIEYNKYDGKEIKYSETAYSYSNDSLKIVTTEEAKYVYRNNEDGTIKKEAYDFDDKTGKELKTGKNEVLTFINGNLIKIVSDWEHEPYVTTCRYDYDTNNNAFKNVLGLNLLLDQADFGSELNFSSANNINTLNVFTNLLPGTNPDEYLKIALCDTPAIPDF